MNARWGHVSLALVLSLVLGVAQPCHGILAISITDDGLGGTVISWSGMGPAAPIGPIMATDLFLSFSGPIYAGGIDPVLFVPISPMSGLSFTAFPPPMGVDMLGGGGVVGSLDGFGPVPSPIILAFDMAGPPIVGPGTYSAAGSVTLPTLPFGIWAPGSYMGVAVPVGSMTEIGIDAATLTITAIPEARAWMMLGLVAIGASAIVFLCRPRTRLVPSLLVG
jgi:hypothetical protein